MISTRRSLTSQRMLWLLVRTKTRCPFRCHGTNICLALSQVASSDVLNRHVYNTAMNSIEKDRSQVFQGWGPIDLGGMQHAAQMHQFAFRSGQYFRYLQSHFTVKNVLLPNAQMLKSCPRSDQPMRYSRDRGNGGGTIGIGLPGRPLSRS